VFLNSVIHLTITDAALLHIGIVLRIWEDGNADQTHTHRRGAQTPSTQMSE